MGELEQLAELVSAPEYAPMRSLLLLLGWDRYPHSGSGQELLNALWTPEVIDKCVRYFNSMVFYIWCIYIHSLFGSTFNLIVWQIS